MLVEFLIKHEMSHHWNGSTAWNWAGQGLTEGKADSEFTDNVKWSASF